MIDAPVSERLDLDAVDVLLAEAQDGSRRVLRQALAAAGLRRVRDSAGPTPGVADFALGEPDLLVIDASDDDGSGVGFVRLLRDRRFGRNPFMSVVVTLFDPTPQRLAAVADAGPDALVVKPVAVNTVRTMVQAVLRPRRPWVVTATYIGPDRRQGGREDGPPSAPVFEVPHVLWRKAHGHPTDGVLEEADAAWEAIRQQRAVQVAMRVLFMATMAMSAPDGGLELAYVDELQRIPESIGDLRRRLDGDPRADDTAEVCDALLEAAAELREDVHRGLRLVPQMRADAVRLACLVTGRDAGDLDRESRAAVRAFRRRTDGG